MNLNTWHYRALFYLLPNAKMEVEKTLFNLSMFQTNLLIWSVVRIHLKARAFKPVTNGHTRSQAEKPAVIQCVYMQLSEQVTQRNM